MRQQYQCYRYDDLNRLTRAFTDNDPGCATPDTGIGDGGYNHIYRYSAGGNITRLGPVTDYTYGTRNDYGTGDAGPHAVTVAGGIDYTYDDAGNLTEAEDGAVTVAAYSYNHRQQLTAVDLPNTSDDLAMVYDTDGNRVTRTQGSTTVTYIGDLYEVIDDNGTATYLTHYYFAGDHIAVRTGQGPTSTLTYQFADQLGSVATTYQAGTAGGTYRNYHYYHPYGTPRGTTTPYPSDHTYTGQINDPDDLMYYQARYYQPALGRFTQPD
ncbi:MAG: hypothetical protein KJ698_05630, partial [Actinobacteria bacterium]|nr:hypothetical protein [Actinomycetota bacterium]